MDKRQYSTDFHVFLDNSKVRLHVSTAQYSVLKKS